VHHHYNGVTKITPTKDWKKGKIQHSSVKEDNWIIREDDGNKYNSRSKNKKLFAI
jgi:predicted site-specific integrase-resolvase